MGLHVGFGSHPNYKTNPGALNSLWNKRLTAANVYTAATSFNALTAGLSSYSGLAYPVYYAKTTDRVVSVLYCSASYGNISGGTWARTGNSGTIETNIRAASVNAFDVTSNTAQPLASRFNYATTVVSPWTLPSGINVTPNPGSGALQVYCPAGVVPCADSDGHMAVYQPDGTVLETYATIILSDGTIVCGNANKTNPGGLLNGLAGGMTASLIPNYAGLIKQTELSRGVINHALALAIPSGELAASFVAPASAFDRTQSYSGTHAMGTRFGIPFSIVLSAHTFESAEGPIIAKAAQNYGLIVVDRGGSGVTIRTDSAITNPEIANPQDYNLYDDLQWIIKQLSVAT